MKFIRANRFWEKYNTNIIYFCISLSTCYKVRMLIIDKSLYIKLNDIKKLILKNL